jgi:hypothetical protein
MQTCFYSLRVLLVLSCFEGTLFAQRKIPFKKLSLFTVLFLLREICTGQKQSRTVAILEKFRMKTSLKLKIWSFSGTFLNASSNTGIDNIKRSTECMLSIVVLDEGQRPYIYMTDISTSHYSYGQSSYVSMTNISTSYYSYGQSFYVSILLQEIIRGNKFFFQETSIDQWTIMSTK